MKLNQIFKFSAFYAPTNQLWEILQILVWSDDWESMNLLGAFYESDFFLKLCVCGFYLSEIDIS